MALLDTQPTYTPPSKEQILAATANRIKQVSVKAFQDIVKIQKEGIDLVWSNPRLTPQEIIDALGEDAVKVFKFHGLLTDFLTDVAEQDGIDYTPAKPTNAFTITDTTVTVTEDPYA